MLTSFVDKFIFLLLPFISTAQNYASQQQYAGYARQNANTYNGYGGYSITPAPTYSNQLQSVNSYPSAQNLYGTSSTSLYPAVTPSSNYLNSAVQQQPYSQYNNPLSFNNLQQPYSSTQQTYTLNSNLQQQQQQPSTYGSADYSQYNSYNSYNLNKQPTQLQSSAMYPNLQTYQSLSNGFTYNTYPSTVITPTAAQLTKDNYNLYSNYYGNYKTAGSDIDQKNLQRYSQYLDILQKHYGIRLPDDNKASTTASVSTISPYNYNGNYEQLSGYNNYNSATNPTYANSALYGYQRLGTPNTYEYSTSSPVASPTQTLTAAAASVISPSVDIYGQSPYVRPAQQTAATSILPTQLPVDVHVNPTLIQSQPTASNVHSPYIGANSIVDYGNQLINPTATSGQIIYGSGEAMSGVIYQNTGNNVTSTNVHSAEVDDYRNSNTEIAASTPASISVTQRTFAYTTPEPVTQSISAVQSKEDTKPMTTISTLTQQIRRLPAVLYVDSRNPDAKRSEQLLRETYGLPLVAFYVDKLEDSGTVEKLLHQLTAHKGLPYLFICGTFIGSQQHIDNYHKNGQVPQLVEYVCSDEQKKRKKKTSS